MANSKKRPLAVFLLKNFRQIGNFILKAKTIVLNIGNNLIFFPTPTPLLPTVTIDIGKLETAEALAETRVVGSAAARDLRYNITLTEIRGLQSYVQSQADNAIDEATAIAIINASGFSLRLNGVHVKSPLAVKQDAATGSVSLIAKSAGRGVIYEWQMSTDGITWTDVPSTLKAKTTISGLAVDVRTYFRFRITLPAGPGSWSALVSIVVQ